MRKLYVPALALLAFSYPLTTVWLLQFDVPIGPANMVIKAAIALLFGLSLLSSINGQGKIPPILIPLYIFYLLYGIRLLDDVINKGITPPLVSPSYILLYFFGLTFMPALSIGMGFRRDDIPSLHRWMFWLLVLANISVAYYSFAVGGVQADEAFSGRLQVAGEIDSSTVLNPIVVSLSGACLALFVIGRLATQRLESSAAQGVHIALFALGMANMLMGGSRGPLIDFAVGLLFVVASLVTTALGRGQVRIHPRIVAYLTMATIGLVFLALSDVISISVFDRFESMFDSGGRATEERDYIFGSAWRDFLASPFTGHSYLTMNGLVMAHNSFLEALMSLGIFGGVAYAFCIWRFLSGVWDAMTGVDASRAYPIALTAVALLALSMTSGSIGQSPDIWGMTVLMMCLSIRAGRGAQLGSPAMQLRSLHRMSSIARHS